MERKFRMISGADHHFIDSNLMPGVEEMMRGVKVLLPSMVIELWPETSIRDQVGYPATIVNTRDKDENCISLAVDVIVAPGSGFYLFVFTTRAAEKGDLLTSKRQNC